MQQHPNIVNVQTPYLPALKAELEFTLVLDLDETLIHYIEMSMPMSDDDNDHGGGGHFLIRPGAHMFLQEMSKHYELVIFTAAMQDYADWVLDQLDTEGYISYRLYRQHALKENHVY